MLIPEILTITDYCQIKKLELDLTRSSIYAITASNGKGKSNILYAFRFALSGQSSPGAQKLSEDIRDNEPSSTVSLKFRLESGTGTITRTIHRTKGTECKLELEINGKKELYIKSTEAERRFTSLLGVSPKHIGEIIIADQHSIDALLFWSGTERGPKFQRFLHGQVFSDIEKMVQSEKRDVRIDPMVTDRLRSLQQTINSHRDVELDTGKLLDKMNSILESDGSKKLRTKQEEVTKFKLFVSKREALMGDVRTAEENIAEVIKEISKSKPGMTEQELQQLAKSAEEAEAAWNAFRPYQKVTEEAARAEGELRRLIPKVKGFKERLDKETELKLLQNQLEASVKRSLADERWEKSKQELESARNLETTALAEEKTAKEAVDACDAEEAKSPVSTLHFLQEALGFMEQHNSENCAVCGGKVDKKRIQELRKQLKSAQSERQKLEERMSNAKKLLRDAENKHISAVAVVDRCKTELKNIEAEIEGMKDIKVVEGAIEKLDACRAEIMQLPLIRQELAELEKSVGTHQASIETASKSEKIPEPSTSDEERGNLVKEWQEEQAKHNKLEDLNKKVSTLEGGLQQIRKQLETCDAEAEASGLPAYGKKFDLSEKEVEKLESLAQLERDREDERVRALGAREARKALEGQLERVKLEAEAFEESERYLEDLEQLITWFRADGIPSQIMQLQLNNLCSKMEEIISRFSLTRNFRLTVDEALDVYMLYPDGTARSIQKASGGERIILGIAFRLATHRYLAPELPFLALDEPSNHLVQANQVVLQEIIRDLKNNLGKFGIRKLLYCTHSASLAGEAEEVITL